MKQLYPDLWQTIVEMRFGTLISHAYLLQRDNGNVLFYTTNDQNEVQTIADDGGAAFHCLSHCHEVDASQAMIKATLGSKLCCHKLVEPYFNGSVSPDVLFSSPDIETLSGDIEVIHTPGHTNNSVCYRYRSPHGKTYLFVGDVLYLDNCKWNTLIVASDGGDKTEMIESLKLLRTLDVDVIICSVALGEMEIREVSRAEWHAIIDGAMADLTA